MSLSRETTGPGEERGLSQPDAKPKQEELSRTYPNTPLTLKLNQGLNYKCKTINPLEKHGRH